MSKKILTIDDSSTVRKLVKFTLNSKGMQIVEAENGLEALEVLKNNTVDAIILDINMPRMNGLEFLQKIKSEDSYAQIPVVMVTTEGQDEDKERAFALGAQEYIVKPFKPSQLLSVLEKVLKIAETN